MLINLRALRLAWLTLCIYAASRAFTLNVARMDCCLRFAAQGNHKGRFAAQGNHKHLDFSE
jgi:hypothetical protein